MSNLLSILTSDGFEERFEEHCRGRRLPQKKAYEITESEHRNLIGKPHYSNFESFKRVRSRRGKR